MQSRRTMGKLQSRLALRMLGVNRNGHPVVSS